MAYITSNWLKSNPEKPSSHYPQEVEMKGYSDNWKDCVYNLEFTHEYIHYTTNGSIEESEFKRVYLSQDEIELILPDLLINASEKIRMDILKSIVPDVSDEFKFELVKLLLNNEKS
jgi:hypothetical protein